MIKRGRPFEPGNKMGRGRPKGSRNKRTLMGKELLEKHGEAIVRQMIVLGLKGDPSILRALLPYVLTRPTSQPTLAGSLPMTTAEDLATTFATVVESIASGQLPLDQGRGIVNLLEARRRLIHTEEFDRRLKALEQLLASPPACCRI